MENIGILLIRYGFILGLYGLYWDYMTDVYIILYIHGQGGRSRRNHEPTTPIESSETEEPVEREKVPQVGHAEICKYQVKRGSPALGSLLPLSWQG